MFSHIPGASSMTDDAVPIATTSAHAARGYSSAVLAWALILSALIAGAAGWLVGEANHERFKPSLEASSQAYAFQALNREKKAADTKNAGLVFGVSGFLMALAAGVGVGLAIGEPRRGLVVGLLGGLLNLALAVGASYALVPIWYQNRDQASADLMLPLLTHGGIWVPLGIGTGLVTGLVCRTRGRDSAPRLSLTILGGLIGAILGTVAFELAAGLLFPLDGTVRPISETSISRLFARLTLPLATAVGILWLVRPSLTTPRAAPIEPVSA